MRRPKADIARRGAPFMPQVKGLGHVLGRMIRVEGVGGLDRLHLVRRVFTPPVGRLAKLPRHAAAEILLIDGPSVLDPELRLELSERYGVGLVRAALQEIDAVAPLAIKPIEALAAITMAALHEAATAIARGANADDQRAVIIALLERITT